MQSEYQFLLKFKKALIYVKIAISKYNNDSWNTFMANSGHSPMSSSKWWIKKKAKQKKSKTNFTPKINNETVTDDKQTAELFAIKLKRL